MEPDRIAAGLGDLLASLNGVIQGKGEVLHAAVTCLVAGGHLLLEDVPGTGKTTLARALAAASGLELRRVQMTSDLLPQDLTGASFPSFDSLDPPALGTPALGVPSAGPSQGPGTFRFVPGPIFTELLLADELNRTPPRTQSALLEAMAEGAVTVEGERYPLPRPFFVIATQNPIEFTGTFPLPESQLDRFMMRLSPGYPDRAAERTLISDRRAHDPLDDVSKNTARRTEVRACLEGAMRAARNVVVADPILEYILDLVGATRGGENRSARPFLLGASPRAALDLDRAARAHALLDGRDHVVPEDVRTLTLPVLAHRLRPTEAAYDDLSSGDELLRQIIDTVPPPRLTGGGDLER